MQAIYDAIVFLCKSLLQTFFRYWGDAVKWALALGLILLGPLGALLAFLSYCVAGMASAVNGWQVPQLGVVPQSIVGILSSANHWFPLDTLFLGFSAWLLLWSCCTTYRFLKSWLENGW